MHGALPVDNVTAVLRQQSVQAIPAMQEHHHLLRMQANSSDQFAPASELRRDMYRWQERCVYECRVIEQGDTPLFEVCNPSRLLCSVSA